MTAACAAALIVSVGCSKSKGGAAGGGGGGGGGGGTAELAIAKAKLKVTAPKGSQVIDMLGDPAVKFPDASMITLGKPSPIQEAEVEKAVKEVKSSYKGASAFKTVKFGNGWAITYINKAPIGTMYMVQARLTFGKTIWMCNANVKNAAQQATALEACKSLKQG